MIFIPTQDDIMRRSAILSIGSTYAWLCGAEIKGRGKLSIKVQIRKEKLLQLIAERSYRVKTGETARVEELKEEIDDMVDDIAMCAMFQSLGPIEKRKKKITGTIKRRRHTVKSHMRIHPRHGKVTFVRSHTRGKRL